MLSEVLIFSNDYFNFKPTYLLSWLPYRTCLQWLRIIAFESVDLPNKLSLLYEIIFRVAVSSASQQLSWHSMFILSPTKAPKFPRKLLLESLKLCLFVHLYMQQGAICWHFLMNYHLCVKPLVQDCENKLPNFFLACSNVDPTSPNIVGATCWPRLNTMLRGSWRRVSIPVSQPKFWLKSQCLRAKTPSSQ